MIEPKPQSLAEALQIRTESGSLIVPFAGFNETPQACQRAIAIALEVKERAAYAEAAKIVQYGFDQGSAPSEIVARLERRAVPNG